MLCVSDTHRTPEGENVAQSRPPGNLPMNPKRVTTHHLRNTAIVFTCLFRLYLQAIHGFQFYSKLVDLAK